MAITPRIYFKAYNFFVLFGPKSDRVVRSASLLGGAIHAYAVWSNPFVPELWIGKAHEAKGETLRAAVEAELARVRGTEDPATASAVLMTADGSPGRIVSAHFGGYRWVPLDLTAKEEGAAMEWAVLEGISWLPLLDVEGGTE